MTLQSLGLFLESGFSIDFCALSLQPLNKLGELDLRKLEPILLAEDRLGWLGWACKSAEHSVRTVK